MNAFAISLVSSVCFVAAFASPQTSWAQVPLVFGNYTFNVPAVNQLDGGNSADPDPSSSLVGRHGDWTTTAGRGWQILSAANHPAGAGGLGFRHFRGDGNNNASGGIRITLPSPLTEMWVRFYMRYQAGFQWNSSTGNPDYTKDHYWNIGVGNILIFGHQGGAWGLHADGVNFPGSVNWVQLMGGAVGDDRWHCFEYHVKQDGANGILEVWVNGVRVLNTTGWLGSTPWVHFALGENQNRVIGAGANDYYTDYDDISISAAGRIGCFGALPAPKNLRVK